MSGMNYYWFLRTKAESMRREQVSITSVLRRLRTPVAKQRDLLKQRAKLFDAERKLRWMAEEIYLTGEQGYEDD